MIALEFITATRPESDEQILVYLLDQRRIAAHQVNAYDTFIGDDVLGFSSCAEPAWHSVYTPASAENLHVGSVRGKPELTKSHVRARDLVRFLQDLH